MEDFSCAKAIDPRYGLFRNYRDFCRIADMVLAIASSNADWHTKYDMIFDKEVMSSLRETDVDFDWDDPDLDYEDDVKAFADALKEKRQHIGAALAALDSAAIA